MSELGANEAVERSIEALLCMRGAADIVHPGGRLLPHLERTARRLQRWGAGVDLVRAGLCHAAYGTHGFPVALFALDERELVREPLGDRAESIVYAYCAYDRDAAGLHTGYLRDRFAGECWMPGASMRRDLAELTAANELDVAQDGALSGPDLSAIGALLLTLLPLLSEAARFDVLQAPCTRGLARRRCELRSADADIAYRELGQGETLLLWHGGASPQLTWDGQLELSQHLTLRIPWRRGFAPSSPTRHQDWEADARDLLRIMPGSVHVLAHSYGAISALMAADRWPQRFRSLTLIEPPLSSIAEREHDIRDPGEARPSLQALKNARVPVTIVSGAHHAAAEIICDALSEKLGARRLRLPGAGHAPQRLPTFNRQLLEQIGSCRPQSGPMVLQPRRTST
jgi:pimeloyl-ACP methyl ester carboxylesterase